MSLEEQDQLVGRLMRERRDCRWRLTALESKVEDAIGNLRAAADNMSHLLDPNRTDPAIAARASVAGVPSEGELLELIREYSEDRERLTHIEKQLSGL